MISIVISLRLSVGATHRQQNSGIFPADVRLSEARWRPHSAALNAASIGKSTPYGIFANMGRKSKRICCSGGQFLDLLAPSRTLCGAGINVFRALSYRESKARRCTEASGQQMAGSRKQWPRNRPLGPESALRQAGNWHTRSDPDDLR